MTVFVDDVATTYSARQTSHKSAGAYLDACLIRRYLTMVSGDGEADQVPVSVWTSKDLSSWPSYLQAEAAKHWWAVSFPMEFDGEVVNLFGGWSEQVRARLERLTRWPTDRLVTINRPLPEYGELLVRRRVKDGSEEELAKLLDDVASKAETWTYDQLLGYPDRYDRLVFGDSHSIAHWMPGSLPLRVDSLTMHRVVTDGLGVVMGRHVAEVAQRPLTRARTLVLVLGNVDVRHHLMRQPDALGAADEMLRELYRQIDEWVGLSQADEVVLVPPLPIEHEDRRIPKTGWYKGTPFFGSRAERLELVRHIWMRMNQMAEAHPAISVDPWPVSWYTMDGEAYAKRYMEKPGSVHVSPAWYRWDLWRDAPNEALRQEYGGQS